MVVLTQVRGLDQHRTSQISLPHRQTGSFYVLQTRPVADQVIGTGMVDLHELVVPAVGQMLRRSHQERVTAL